MKRSTPSSMSTKNKKSPPTPSSLGYRMPAEWEEHEGTWLSWPKDPITWPEQIKEVKDIYTQIIELLIPYEKIFLLVNDERTEETVRKELRGKNIQDKNLILYQIETVDAWIRDYGPNFIVRGKDRTKELAFNHWIFNAWGNKYEELKEDANVPNAIESILEVPVFRPNIVLEGGSIDVNGQGTCLTTEQCLLAPTRNPQLKRKQIEKYLKDYLGVSHIIWLGAGIDGDDTDGHVDDIARFVDSHTIVCALEEDPNDENYQPLQDNYQRLKSATDEKGRKLNVISLPMPGKVTYKGDRLPASYANFYIANEAVLVPIYRHHNDKKALQILQELFPDHEIVGIPCEALVVGLGAFHCITQQQPKASP